MRIKTQIDSIDKELLTSTAVDLGLTRDIKLLEWKLPYDIRGVHYFRPFLRLHHTIYLSSDLLKLPVLANKTLWHEIAHAVQAETAGTPRAWDQRIEQEKALIYDLRPMEQEAREFAHIMSSVVNLLH